MKKASFISDMMAHYRRSAFGPNDVAAVSDLKLRVQEVASQSANKARVELFGSLVSGFCKPGSDADLSMTYRNFSPWLQGLSRVSDQDNRRLMRFSRVAAENGFEEVKYIRARIPVVQFVDPVSGIHCDLSIGNLGGVQNSQILHAIHNMYPDFYSAYIHVVKEWGKAREVVCPAKVTFNSFTITTMSLMVLQELGLLPIFRPTGELGELLLSDAQRDIEAFSLPPLYKTLEGDDQKLGEAVFFCFQRFADYYSKFDFTQGTVSLMYPRRHRKVYADIVAESMRRFEAKKRAAWVAHIAATPDDGPFNEKDFTESIEHEKVQRVSNTPFVVEDFVNYVNSGRRAQPSRAPHILSEFSRLAQLLRREDDLSFEEVFTVSNVVPNFRSPGQPDHRVSTFDTSHG